MITTFVELPIVSGNSHTESSEPFAINNINDSILFNKMYVMCFNLHFSLWFMLLVFPCARVTQYWGNIGVARDFYAKRKSPVLLISET